MSTKTVPTPPHTVPKVKHALVQGTLEGSISHRIPRLASVGLATILTNTFVKARQGLVKPVETRGKIIGNNHTQNIYD